MAKRGIDNVLGNLLGPTPEAVQPVGSKQESEPVPPSAPSVAETPSLPDKKEKPKPKAKPVAARRGRPPGTRAEGMAEKKKVTWSIDPELYETFVRRSYREECQMWELLERALKEYLKKPVKE